MTYNELIRRKGQNVLAWTNEGKVLGRLKEILIQEYDKRADGSFKIKYLGLIETITGEKVVPREDIYRTRDA